MVTENAVTLEWGKRSLDSGLEEKSILDDELIMEIQARLDWFELVQIFETNCWLKMG